jgi:hypothetical protein
MSALLVVFWKLLSVSNRLGVAILDHITQGLLAACKAALQHFTNRNSLVGHQLRSAIAMAESGHIPRRPLPDLLAREAEVVGAALDAESLEHGEVTL